MRVVSRQSDLLGLLHAYVDMLRLRAEAIAGAAGPLAAGHIRDLIAAIAATDIDGPSLPERPGVKAARLQANKTQIARCLCDPQPAVEGEVGKCTRREREGTSG